VGLLRSGLERRARRALERQLDYQQAKARFVRGREQEIIAAKLARASEIRRKLESVRPIGADARVLEVGCGAHGLVFFLGAEGGVGVDPLADHYARLFPAWQERARTVAAKGEQLPFEDDSFDVVLCDNVVDHAQSPRRIVEEIERVLAPGGILYFEVNVHHPVYHAAASVHAGWQALGLPFEITPFADHTVHLTPGAAKRLFGGLKLRIVGECDDIAETRLYSRTLKPRHMGDRLKRFFFKNASYEVVAVAA
jgi:SAM-dependent methyltransferase